MILNNIDFFLCEFDETDCISIDDDFYKEREFLGGWTVSERHPIKGFKRKSSKLSLPDKETSKISTTELKNILENTIKKYATENNVLFLSGGKDSTALAYSFKNLGIPFTPVCLYSEISTTTEKHIVESLSTELDLKTIFFEVSVIPKINFKYWADNTYTAKKLAVESLNLTNFTLFTGEIGTGEMQVTQSLQYTAMMGYDPVALSRWHVNVCGSYRRVNSAIEMYDDDIYRECVAHFEYRFNEWECHPDILNRIMFSRLQDEGAYRLFNYNQDDLKWIHPYAENEFIKNCVNMPSKFKGNKNLFKLMYPNLPTLPWTFPKSGLGIPTVK